LDTLSRSRLRTKLLPYGKVGLPIGYEESVALEQIDHDDRSKLYTFVTTKGAENSGYLAPSFNGTQGIASTNGNDVGGFGWGILVFTRDHDGSRNHSRSTHLQKTITHEIGHILGAGRADDGKGLNPFGEIYSGAQRNGIDETLEYSGISGYNDPRWSVMTRGWVDDLEAPPMNGNYIAFSLEELSTIEFNNIATVRKD
jgi:hypothetical protein